MNKYGHVVSAYNDEYYFVETEDSKKRYLYHKSELIDMTTFKPEYQVGDRVIIQDIPENEKDNYPPDWIAEMDDCVEDTVTITDILDSPNFYTVSENDFIWHSSNLEPVTTYIAY